MMIDIHSKHEYFNKELQIEKQKILRLKENIEELRDNHTFNIDINNKTCQKCSRWIDCFDFNYIINHVLENNRHIKSLYNDTLLPLQDLLIGICLLNTMCIVTIFKKAIKLFLISILLTILCLLIYAEVFIEDKPNVYYTLITAVTIFVFSIFLLMKIHLTLLNIIQYKKIKDILTNE